MTKTITTIRSKPALVVAGLCATGTLAVLFDDVLRGGEPNIQHLISCVTLIATFYAGYAIWSAFRSQPFAALGAALIFLAGTSYVVLTSAGRSAHVMAAKAIDATEANSRYAKATARADKAEATYEAAKSAAASECASGDGKRCSGKRITAEVAKIDAKEARDDAAKLKPAVAASDYLQAATLFSTFTGKPKQEVEAMLLLGMPFLLASILELGFMVFGHLAIGHTVVEDVPRLAAPAPVLKAETIPEAPKVLTADMVAKLKAEGKKHSEIASMFGVNQGRVSELLNGQRNIVVLN